MNDELLKTVIGVASDVLDVPISDVDAESSSESIASWDSISHLNLILSVEQACGVSFAPDRMPDLTTIHAIVDEVERLR